MCGVASIKSSMSVGIVAAMQWKAGWRHRREASAGGGVMRNMYDENEEEIFNESNNLNENLNLSDMKWYLAIHMTNNKEKPIYQYQLKTSYQKTIQ